MDQAVLALDEQLVKDQRVGFLAQAPEHHQDDDLQVLERQRAGGNRHRAVDHHLAHAAEAAAARAALVAARPDVMVVAAYGLLLPAQDEALTVQATRKALAKLDADPDQLLK